MNLHLRLITTNARRAEEAANQAEAFAKNNDPVGAELEAKAAGTETIEASANFATIQALFLTTDPNDEEKIKRGEETIEKARAFFAQTKRAARRAEDAMTRAIAAEVKRNNPPNP